MNTPQSAKNGCLFCGHATYRLSDGRRKCSRCGLRYSPKRWARERAVIAAFCEDHSARAAGQKLSLSYVAVKRSYDRIRHLLLPYLETCYARRRDEVSEYDEYLYLDHVKRRDKRYIFDAHNFLTFDYGGKVYNILMPSLARYKKEFLADGLETLYYEEFSRFLKIRRIANIRRFDNTIVAFWRFFDTFMKRYKGVRPDRFILYLKEAEFKFNHPPAEREKIVQRLWIESYYNPNSKPDTGFPK